MKEPYPRVFPIWLLPLLVLIGFILIQCGCKTGGTRLNPNSAGTIIRTNDVRPNFQPLPPAPTAPPRSTPIAIPNPARSAPTLPESQSVKANPVVVNPKSAGELEPFAPTVSAVPTKLPPAETKLPPKIIAGDGGYVRPLPTDNNTTTPEIAGPREAAPEEEKSLSANWVGLFSFFMMCLLGTIGLWVVRDTIADSIQMGKQGTPIKDHLENLKKPAKGTKASRKKAITTKKKATRRKK